MQTCQKSVARRFADSSTEEPLGCCLYYKSGISITTSDLPNFGEGPDGRAIAAGLDVFHMRPLPRVRKSVTGWLRKNCLSVFHYCA